MCSKRFQVRLGHSMIDRRIKETTDLVFIFKIFYVLRFDADVYLLHFCDGFNVSANLQFCLDEMLWVVRWTDRSAGLPVC